MGNCIKCGKETENSYTLHMAVVTEHRTATLGNYRQYITEGKIIGSFSKFACTKCALSSSLRVNTVFSFTAVRFSI